MNNIKRNYLKKNWQDQSFSFREEKKKKKSINLEKFSDKELLEKYFVLACAFNDDGLNDVKLDKLYTVEDEILRRMKKDEI